MRRLALLLALTLASAGVAANSKATALAKEADKLYRDNKYKEAAQTLEQAYEADPVGLYLYNIARAYDQAGELESSMEYYRKYVGLPSDQSTPDLVKKANLAMDRLRTLVARREADKTVNNAEKQRLEEEARKAEARADAEAAEARRQRKAFEEQERTRKDAEAVKINGRKLGAYIAGGVGIVGLGTALGFGLGANANREAFRKATTLADKQALQGATQATAAVSDVGLLLGLAGAVTAVILYPKNLDGDKAVSVVIAPTAGGAAASFGMRF